eukprot:gnl/Spiro4/12870_TR6820_c0_g1_i1.p1 gnl/Spiro4/12870_TR6820_c0_g1~~gnl/Spiro4/12870_TR6820_c0_g1_i1.p1  ORF type:complete len:158 (+),score=20.31 gnl/Spiro4/12870_TR6820_c0_g1_i1:119-592(+)
MADKTHILLVPALQMLLVTSCAYLYLGLYLFYMAFNFVLLLLLIPYLIISLCSLFVISKIGSILEVFVALSNETRHSLENASHQSILGEHHLPEHRTLAAHAPPTHHPRRPRLISTFSPAHGAPVIRPPRIVKRVRLHSTLVAVPEEISGTCPLKNI